MRKGRVRKVTGVRVLLVGPAEFQNLKSTITPSRPALGDYLAFIYFHQLAPHTANSIQEEVGSERR